MADEIRFDGKVAIVTGAGGGLGRTHALLLGSRGAKVVVNDLGQASCTGDGDGSATMADAVVKEIKDAGGEAVANGDSVVDGAKIVQCAMDSYGAVDIIINNAGILRDISFKKMTDKDWDLVVDVHLKGSYAVTKAAWNHMYDKDYGRIIMTSSAAGIYGNRGQANYSAAKMALVGLGQTLGTEGKKHNVLCNVIAPVAGSRMTETVMPPPMLEALKPEYVSPLVAYLCSEECKVTGGVFEVGAGFFAQVNWTRAPGLALPIGEGASVTPEQVRDGLAQIQNVEEGKLMKNVDASIQSFMKIVSTAKK